MRYTDTTNTFLKAKTQNYEGRTIHYVEIICKGR